MMIFSQIIGEFLVGRLGEDGFFPQVRGQVGVRLGDGGVGRFSEVTQSSGASPGRSVTIFDTGHHQQLLGNGGGNDSGTSRSGNQTDPNGSALSGHLARNGVRFTDLITPETSSNGNDRELSQDDGASNGRRHFLGAFNSETHVSVEVSDGHESLESGSLTGSSLLLNGHNLEDFVFESGSDEEIDDFVLFDGQRKQVNLFQRFNFSVFD